ncbi:MAG: transposase [Candidatus Accumulibacter sp.]|jgi:transposase InsO family protein|nr:transposase [Accumulibacter sp.]
MTKPIPPTPPNPATLERDEDMASKLAPAVVEDLFRLREELAAAPHGAARQAVEGFAARHGRNPATVYAWLRAHTGFKAGRKKRSDAGSTKVPAAALDFLAATARESMRANGKRTMPLSVALDVAQANGIAVEVSTAHAARLLRTRRLDAKRTAAARNHGALRSLCPNHVHEIDPSLCLLYYMGGRQRLMREEDFNKNKLAAWARVKLKVLRYVRYDHFSGAIDVRYFEAAGENQATLFEFLMWTWGRQEGRLSYGVPQLLLWDKGSANISRGIQTLCEALGVRTLTHFAGHSWVKGGAEVSNNIVETQFESRLRFEPVENIERLNAAALAWCRDYNTNAIARVDSRLKRASGEPLVRDDLWQTILRHENALVELPERKVCLWFMHGREETRRVRNCQLSFAHPELGRAARYDLSEWAQFLGQNMPVRVKPLLLREGAVRVEIDQLGREPLIVEAAPVREFDEAGRLLSAQVIGEGYRRAKDTLDEQNAKRLGKAAYGEAAATLDEADAARAKQERPFAGFNGGQGLTAHSHLGQAPQPARLLPKAAALSTPALEAAQTARVRVAPLSVVEAARAIRARIGAAWVPATHFAWLQSRYPEGVPPEEIEAIAARIEDRAGARLASVK